MTIPAGPEGVARRNQRPSCPGPSLVERWDSLAAAISEYRDVLDGRPLGGEVPPALEERGWVECLLAMSEAELSEIEIAGQRASWPEHLPPSLTRLISTAAQLCSVPEWTHPPRSPRALRRFETPRKRAQIEALAELVLPLAREATRVVDVGAGHGHLIREIAEHTDLPIVGLERDATLTARARSLSCSAHLSFELSDVLHDGLSFLAGDCALGLHACGELGDAFVTSVAERADSAVLVGCCLQKRRASSRPALALHRALSKEVDLPKTLLGLSNLTSRDEGVEASRAENLAARGRRMALNRLLSKLDGPLRSGVEMDGLNRRAAQGDLDGMVARAFELRQRPLPSRDEVDEAVQWADVQHGRMRRLSLPRTMLARVLEVFVLVDRALYLEARGFEVAIGTPFGPEVSARNLALVARRREPSTHV